MTPEGVLSALKRFYFDTALSPSPEAMGALTRLVDPSHILFGSDFPFAPEPLVATEVRDLAGLAEVPGPDQEGIARRHALALFPRLATPGESATVVAPRSARQGLRAQVQGVALRALAGVADRMRNR